MIYLSYNEALKIQREQIEHWKRIMTQKELETIIAMTKPCPPEFEPDQPMPIYKINELVPRGVSIERIMGIHSSSLLSEG